MLAAVSDGAVGAPPKTKAVGDPVVRIGRTTIFAKPVPVKAQAVPPDKTEKVIYDAAAVFT